MPRRTGGDDDDRRLFEEEMRGVRRLNPGRGRVVGSPPPAPRPRLTPPAMSLRQVEDAAVEGADPSVPRDRLRALRRGEVRPEATLDLHGRSAAEAHVAVDAFLQAARAGGHRCVLVVHGRGHGSGPGGPVLRPLVVAMLARRPQVLAYVPAPPALGGVGATLVLLRRR